MSAFGDACRYLGITSRPDLRTAADIRRHLAWLEENVRGRAVWDIFSRDILPRSRDLAEHLGAAQTVLLFAGTLGAAADNRRRHLEVLSQADAVIYNACASAYAEVFCDQNAPAQVAGKTRYSPGYGDLELSFNAEICRKLDAGKRIGLTVSADFLLVPSKSITGVYAVC